MTAGPYVTYYRVSTRRQGESGLGLEAQRAAVARYLEANPGPVIGDFTEIESGRNCARPKIVEALWLCRVYRARLVVARIDRLARNTALVAKLMESGVDFVAADMPRANRFTVHILAAVAEYESNLTAVRTKAALAILKAQGRHRRRGVNPNCRESLKRARAAWAAMRQRRAAARAADMAPLLCELRDQGKTINGIADALTTMGIAPPSKGKRWRSHVVARMFDTAHEQRPRRGPGAYQRIAKPRSEPPDE